MGHLNTPQIYFGLKRNTYRMNYYMPALKMSFTCAVFVLDF